jgi:hypothetical protein
MTHALDLACLFNSPVVHVKEAAHSLLVNVVAIRLDRLARFSECYDML